jgi:hypothetical protein
MFMALLAVHQGAHNSIKHLFNVAGLELQSTEWKM